MQNTAAISKKEAEEQEWRAKSPEKNRGETLHNQNKTHERLEQRRGLSFNVAPPRYSVYAHLQHRDAAAVIYLPLAFGAASWSLEVVWFWPQPTQLPLLEETSPRLAAPGRGNTSDEKTELIVGS